MYLDFPPEPKRGEPLDVNWGVKVARCLRSLALLSGVGYRIKRDGNGTRLEIVDRGGRGLVFDPLFPFRPTIGAPNEEGERAVTFRPGWINGISPRIGSDPEESPRLDDLVPPVLTIPAGLGRIYARCTFNTMMQVNDVEILHTSGTVPGHVVDYETPENTVGNILLHRIFPADNANGQWANAVQSSLLVYVSTNGQIESVSQ